MSTISYLLRRIRALFTGEERTVATTTPIPVPPGFACHDTNGDGVVTVEELEKTGGDWWSFLGMDRDGDAAVSLGEYNKHKLPAVAGEWSKE